MCPRLTRLLQLWREFRWLLETACLPVPSLRPPLCFLPAASTSLVSAFCLRCRLHRVCSCKVFLDSAPWFEETGFSVKSSWDPRGQGSLPLASALPQRFVRPTFASTREARRCGFAAHLESAVVLSPLSFSFQNIFCYS